MRLAFTATALLAALAAAQAEPLPAKLPRVLLIGDVSLNNHFQNAQKALKGRAEVVRSPLGHLSTGAALQRLDEILKKQRWDVVCVNFGINDLMHRDPRSAQVRAMSPAAGGVRVTQLKDYQANLKRLSEKMHASSAQVLWLTTMPLQPRQRSTAIQPDDIARYNAAAAACMKACGVETVDLHEQVTEALRGAKNERDRNHQHHLLFKTDLSAPLVEAVTKTPSNTTHQDREQAHCSRCEASWGARDLRTCRLHHAAGVSMDPRCDVCRHHGAYKFLFYQHVTEARRRALRAGDEPARPQRP